MDYCLDSQGACFTIKYMKYIYKSVVTTLYSSFLSMQTKTKMQMQNVNAKQKESGDNNWEFTGNISQEYVLNVQQTLFLRETPPTFDVRF